jgi:hypothetical protein
MYEPPQPWFFVLGMETNKIIPLGAKIGRGVDAF